MRYWDKRMAVRRLCIDAALLGVALMLSYIEALLPVNALLPLPGFRLGLAQLVVTFAFFRVGRSDAAVLSATRVVIVSLLFGQVTSFCFSASGALLAYLGLWMGAFLLKKRCSYIGLGVLCATLHNLGQALAASLLFQAPIVLSYLPALMLAAVLFGGIGGVLLNVVDLHLPHTISKGALHREQM